MSRPWLDHYAKGVPHHVDHRVACLHELLPESAAKYPERDAIAFAVPAAGRLFTSSMSYARLHGLVERFAAGLQRLGIAKGDRVALHLPNCPQFVIAYLAAQRVGAIAVPFNPLYSAREVEYQLADCGAKLVVTLTSFFPLIKKVQAQTGLVHVVVAGIKEYFPPALWLLYSLTKGRKEPRVRLGAGDHRFGALLGPGAPTPVSVNEEETAVLLYTGGTTGVSKGVELSHRNLVYNAEQCRAWAGMGAGTESILVALPMFHAFGLTCGLNLGMHTGATLVLFPNPAETRGLVETIQRLRPTVFPVVPTLLVSMSNLPGIEGYALGSVRVCPCAGSALAPAVQQAFIEKTGIRPNEGYGLTEAAPVTHGNPPGGENRHGTIGLPYPDVDARIVDPDTGVEVGFDGDWTRPGELQVRGPQVMKGYWNRPEATAEQLCDGWLRTGDLVQMHRDGYFRIVDRLKDLIIRGGLNVYPAEVEALLYDHPAVLEALVIGVPDVKLGEQVKAFVVPRPGRAVTEEELIAHCREGLARYKVPSAIEVRSSLPRSAVGKPLRRKLREELAAERARKAA